RQYKVAVYVLFSQSTLLFAHFAIWNWCVNDAEKIWWLKDSVLWTTMVLVTLGGALVATLRRRRSPDLAAGQPPARVEYFALGALVVAGLGWGAWQFWTQEPPFRDEMAVVLFGALLGFGHLLYRQWAPGKPLMTTELVLLWGMVLAGTGLGIYVYGG